MPDEKSIERRLVLRGPATVKAPGRIVSFTGREPGPAEEIEFMPVYDHLDALGEAEDRSVANGEELCRQRNRTARAEKKLETLRSGLKAELDWYRERAEHFEERFRDPSLLIETRAMERGSRNIALAVVARLSDLLDASEDTEKPCEYCDGETGYWVTSGRLGDSVGKRSWVKCPRCSATGLAKNYPPEDTHPQESEGSGS